MAIIHACRTLFSFGKLKNLKSLWLFLRPSLLRVAYTAMEVRHLGKRDKGV